MKDQPKLAKRLNLNRELTRGEMKQIAGGSTQQTYCDGHGSAGPFPVAGSTPIGCQPGYCGGIYFHGSFLYCA